MTPDYFCPLARGGIKGRIAVISPIYNQAWTATAAINPGFFRGLNGKQ